MKYFTYIIAIVFVLSLTVYSCASNDDDSSTSTATYTIKGSI